VSVIVVDAQPVRERPIDERISDIEAALGALLRAERTEPAPSRPIVVAVDVEWVLRWVLPVLCGGLLALAFTAWLCALLLLVWPGLA
jgi:hypothetical protein